MSDQPTPNEPPSPPPYPYPSTPPTEAGVIAAPPQKSKWPTVIGVIAIVLAAFGLPGGVCGMLLPRLMSMVPDNDDPALAAMRQTSGPLMVLMLVGMGFSACLLAIGIGLVKRRPWSPTWAIRWSIVYVLFSFVSTIMSYSIQMEQFEAMANQGGNAAAAMQGMRVGGMIGTCFGLAWAWALPVFFLIWFSRAKIKAEVATWQPTGTTLGESQPMA